MKAAGPMFRVTLALGALVAVDLLAPSVNLVAPAPAHAVVGMPLTPVSYAGVARRTTRRTVYATAAVAAPTAVVVAAPVAAPPRTCTTHYDSYGRQVTTCY